MDTEPVACWGYCHGCRRLECRLDGESVCAGCGRTLNMVEFDSDQIKARAAGLVGQHRQRGEANLS
jgi:predicted Fe-S protein YdhL (DUF1289 family)